MEDAAAGIFRKKPPGAVDDANLAALPGGWGGWA